MLKYAIMLYVLFLMFGFTILIFQTFFTAYFSEEKACIVYIDKFGEADFEFIFLTLLFPIILYGTILIYKNLSSSSSLSSSSH